MAHYTLPRKSRLISFAIHTSGNLTAGVSATELGPSYEVELGDAFDDYYVDDDAYIRGDWREPPVWEDTEELEAEEKMLKSCREMKADVAAEDAAV